MHCNLSTNEVYQFTSNYVWEKIEITDATIATEKPTNPLIGDVYVNPSNGEKYTFSEGEMRGTLFAFKYKHADSNNNIIIPVGEIGEQLKDEYYLGSNFGYFEISDVDNSIVYARTATKDKFIEKYDVDCTELSTNPNVNVKIDNAEITINSDGTATFIANVSIFNPDTNEYITQQFTPEEPMMSNYIWVTDSSIMLLGENNMQLSLGEGLYIYFEKTGDKTLELRLGKPGDESFNIDMSTIIEQGGETGLPEGAVITATGKICYGIDEYGYFVNQLEIKMTAQYYDDVQHANVEMIQYSYENYQIGVYGRIEMSADTYLEPSKNVANTYNVCFGDVNAYKNYILEDGSILTLYKDGTANMTSDLTSDIKLNYFFADDDILVITSPLLYIGRLFKIEGYKAIKHVDPFVNNNKFTKDVVYNMVLGEEGFFGEAPIYIDEITGRCYIVYDKDGEVACFMGARIDTDTYRVTVGALGVSYIVKKVGNQMMYKSLIGL